MFRFESSYDEENPFITFKVILIGDSLVGKTSIIKRYFDNVFEEVCVSTIGVDSKIKQFDKGNEKYELQVWDTAGEERFKSLARSCCNQMDGIIFVFDLHNKQTFDDIKNWYENIKEIVNIERLSILLLGNKTDLLRKVDKKTIGKYCEKNKMKYLECSAKSGNGVEEIFTTILDDLIELKKDQANSSTLSRGISLGSKKATTIEKKSKKCCN